MKKMLIVGIMIFLSTISFAKEKALECEREGNVNSCFEQAEELVTQQGMMETALFYYEKACKGGIVDGCFRLGHHGFNEEQKILALEVLQESCSLNDWPACTHLGNLTYKNNKEKGLEILKNTCNFNNVDACLSLGYLAKTEGDIQTAKKAYKKACDLEDFGGCYNLKQLNEEGMKKEDLN